MPDTQRDDPLPTTQLCKTNRTTLYQPTPHLSIFHEVREHDHGSNFPVVQYLQHVPDSGFHWTLSYDVGFLVLVALYKEVGEIMVACIHIELVCADATPTVRHCANATPTV